MQSGTGITNCDSLQCESNSQVVLGSLPSSWNTFQAILSVNLSTSQHSESSTLVTFGTPDAFISVARSGANEALVVFSMPTQSFQFSLGQIADQSFDVTIRFNPALLSAQVQGQAPVTRTLDGADAISQTITLGSTPMCVHALMINNADAFATLGVAHAVAAAECS